METVVFAQILVSLLFGLEVDFVVFFVVEGVGYDTLEGVFECLVIEGFDLVGMKELVSEGLMALFHFNFK